jgi:chitodextrinase
VNGQTSNGVTFFVNSNTSTAYPLKASVNGRYLVDQNNVPFLLVGDTSHGLSGKMSEADAALYFANRLTNGFNSVVIYAPCARYIECNDDGTTFDGIAPFTSGDSPQNYDLSTPNETYFSRLDNLLNLAASNGLNVFLDPLETGDFLDTLRNNGPQRAFDYGVYVGTRYRNFPNIVWLLGEDFQSWFSNPDDNQLVAQLMAGIASVDSNHLQTLQLDYFRSYSNQDTDVVGPYLTYDMVYTYYETYDYVLAAYNSSPTIPAYLGEANYEGENNTLGLPGPAGTGVLRRQTYWTLLSGGFGHLWGNHYINHVLPEWRDNLDTPGASQIRHSTNLFSTYEWWNLVPDQTHDIVTGGYGSYNSENQDFTAADYVTAAWNPDGTLAMAYTPAPTTLSVDLSRFVRPIVARWYDPSAGTFRAIAGSPFSNSGTETFATPGLNDDGDTDWVLVLDATPATLDTQPPTSPANLTATAVINGLITLNWTASTDNHRVAGYLIERCEGTGCGGFVYVATTTSTSYGDAGLPVLTTYRYRVRATDPAGNLSGYSNVATATTSNTADSTPPTAPGSLTATALSGNRVNLGWTASIDNVGVTNYLIERCQGAGCSTFAQIATSFAPGFIDSSLAASTSYSYRVRAIDGAGNTSAYSNVATAATAAGAIAFVQASYETPQTPQSSVSVTFPAPQTGGNLIVAVVGWNDSTSQVRSISDSMGNTYVRAVGPTVQSGIATQSIYYAANISASPAGANQVTVEFSGPARYADVRIAEYSGIDPVNPVDGAVAAQGTGSTSGSGSLTTTSASVLLVAANIVQTSTTSAGTNFTSRVITYPDGDILEDRIVNAVGNYSATASVAPPDSWIMQLVAFRAAPGSNGQ